MVFAIALGLCKAPSLGLFEAPKQEALESFWDLAKPLAWGFQETP